MVLLISTVSHLVASRFVSLSDLDPKAMVDYLVKLGCLQEVETISVTVDINADSHVFQVEARKYNSVPVGSQSTEGVKLTWTTKGRRSYVGLFQAPRL